jgi:putative FmdB family regulatory protein
MPTYDYRCEACDHQFEQFQSITAEPLKQCPKCKKQRLRRLIGTGAALLFKGEGFYITDYRSESYKNAQKAEAGAGTTTGGDAKSDGKADGKAETKPAEKPVAATAEAKPVTKAEPKPKKKK